MAQPIAFDIPHRLGKAVARARIDNGLGDLDRAIPFASAVEKRWSGDRLAIDVTAFGSVTTAHIDIEDTRVRIELALPGLLGGFAERIAAFFRTRATQLLEDHRDA